MDKDAIHRLRNPPQTPLDLSATPGLRLSLDLFLAGGHTSQKNYSDACAAVIREYPDAKAKLLSYYQCKRRVEEITGVVPIICDMCVKTCVAYTGVLRLTLQYCQLTFNFVGPFADLDHCPECGEARYEPQKPRAKRRVPRRTFQTMPLGPQLQALWRSPDGATKMRYRAEQTEKIMEELAEDPNISTYSDFYHGALYTEAVQEGRVGPDDMLLMLSIDGAQLYHMKKSDCWIYIWVILDLSPELRYKKKYVLPGGFIPGLHPPQIMALYASPALYQLAALQ